MVRDRSIDVAKGLLIIIVVYFHLSCMQEGVGIKDSVFELFVVTKWSFISFFMPAFFIITGICSNFRKEFKQYFIDNFITIIFPAIIFQLLCAWMMLVNYKNADPYIYFHSMIERIQSVFFYGSRYWFLNALFIGKIIYWFVNKIKSQFIKLTICIIIMIIGVMQQPSPSDFWNVWHAFAIVPFFYIGGVIKSIDYSHNLFGISSIVYVFLLSLSYLFKIDIPSITLYFDCSLIQVPYWLALSISGSIMVIQFSKFIKKCVILEFFGKGSLIIYCIHMDVYTILYMHTVRFFNLSTTISLVTISAIFVLNVLFCSLAVFIIQKPAFRWIIGKNPFKNK